MKRYNALLPILILQACTQTTPIPVVDFMAIKTKQQQQFPSSLLLQNTAIIDSYYTPNIVSTDLFKPAWWFEPVQQWQLNQLTFADLMQLLSDTYSIVVSYELGVEKDLPIDINFSGEVGELIQQMVYLTQYHYQIEGQHLTWKKYLSKQFDISFISESANNLSDRNEPTIQAPIQPLTQHQEIEETPNQTTKYATQPNLWQELEKQLQTLSSVEGQFSISPLAASIYVRDLPKNITEIEQYLTKLNQKLTQLITIDVQILEVRLNNGFNYGVDWNILASTMSDQSLLQLSSQGILNTNNIISNDLVANQLQFNILDQTSSTLAGSSVLIEALEQQGQVQVINSPRVVTLNNQIAEIAITEKTTYLASSSTRSTANVGAETTLQPGIIESGLILRILPLKRNKDVLLQIHLDLSTLQSISTVESGEAKIQTPNVLDKQLTQKAIVPSGKTLLLAGLKTQRQHQQESGLFGQSWLNGQTQQQQRQSEVIVLITPHLLGQEK